MLPLISKVIKQVHFWIRKNYFNLVFEIKTLLVCYWFFCFFWHAGIRFYFGVTLIFSIFQVHLTSCQINASCLLLYGDSWFVDKTKSVSLLHSKEKMLKNCSLRYGDIKTKQHSEVKQYSRMLFGWNNVWKSYGAWC